jgi:hypothetical protein
LHSAIRRQAQHDYQKKLEDSSSGVIPNAVRVTSPERGQRGLLTTPNTLTPNRRDSATPNSITKLRICIPPCFDRLSMTTKKLGPISSGVIPNVVRVTSPERGQRGLLNGPTSQYQSYGLH